MGDGIKSLTGTLPRIRNENGFAAGAISLTLLTISVLVAAGFSQVNARNNLSSKDRNDQSAASLKTRLEMLFTHDHLCRQNLRAGAFGSTINEARAASRRGRIQVADASYVPTAGAMNSPINPRIDFTAGTTYQGVRISRIILAPMQNSTLPIFNPATALRGTNSYLVNLEIHFEASTTMVSRPVRIPFYFATNGSGVLTDCFASTIPHPERHPDKTLEDFLCEKLSGSNYFFDPESKMCIDGTV